MRFFISLLVFAAAALFGEVQQVTIKWTPGLCQSGCIQKLGEQLRKVEGVADIALNQNQGQANIRWLPGIAFKYYPVHAAMSMLGLAMQDLRIQARGTISHEGSSVILNSLGDNTRLILLSPIQPEPNKYVTQHNMASHQLSKTMRMQLLEAENRRQVVTIEGPLFQPERGPPLYLIIEKLFIEQSKN